jgi:import inner membrane translocase subunit TIM50
MFAFGKAFKYTIWASTVLFGYHYYLIKKVDEPKFKLDPFLELALFADWHLYNIRLMFTRPPVEKLLQDRPPLPPGAAYPKTLVLNLRGTLIHSEYKFGVGFEV